MVYVFVNGAGPIPSELGQLDRFQALYLGTNQLTGAFMALANSVFCEELQLCWW